MAKGAKSQENHFQRVYPLQRETKQNADPIGLLRLNSYLPFEQEGILLYNSSTNVNKHVVLTSVFRLEIERLIVEPDIYHKPHYHYYPRKISPFDPHHLPPW